MAASVNEFCMKNGCPLPSVSYATCPPTGFSCSVTLHAYLNNANDGFPEMSFTEQARSKKAAKNLAMERAWDFITKQPIYKKMGTSDNSPWNLLNQLFSEKLPKQPDARVNVVLARAFLDGWLPLAALIDNQTLRRYFKKASGRTAVEQLTQLRHDLMASPAPIAGIELSPSGWSLRVNYASDAAAAEALNPGYLDARPGPTACQDALNVLWTHDNAHHSEHVTAVLVPTDPREPMKEVMLPCSGHLRARIAEVLKAPVDEVVRVSKLEKCVMLQDASALTDQAAASGAHPPPDGAAANKNGSDSCAPPAKRICCQSSDEESDDTGGGSTLGKRQLNASHTIDQAAAHTHPALRKRRGPDCYAIVTGADLPINHRASLIAGCPVKGDLLVTFVRLTQTAFNEASNAAQAPPMDEEVRVALNPVLAAHWSSFASAQALQIAAAHLSTALPDDATGSLISCLPHKYGHSWDGTRPTQLLQRYAARLFLNDNEKPEYNNSPPPVSGPDGLPASSHSCSCRLTRLGRSDVAASATVRRVDFPNSDLAQVAREAAALAVLHRLAEEDVSAFAADLPSPNGTHDGSAGANVMAGAQMESEGSGYCFVEGDVVKAGYQLQIREESEDCAICVASGNISFVVGSGAVLPEIEAMARQMRPGASGIQAVRMPATGRHPLSVAFPTIVYHVRLEATGLAAPPISPLAIFHPPLAQQRHAVIRDILHRHGCGGRVVDVGCGEGVLVRSMLADPRNAAPGCVVGVDVSEGSLVRARKIVASALVEWLKRQHLRQGEEVLRPFIGLYRGDIVRLQSREQWGDVCGFEAAVACEVVEHMHQPDALASAILGVIRPRVAVITTPNMEYNAIIRHLQLPKNVKGMPIGSDGFAMRDADHKFEWSRAEFEHWARGHAAAHGYEVVFETVGRALREDSWWDSQDGSKDVGGATQVATFLRTASDSSAQASSSLSFPGASLVQDFNSLAQADMERMRREYMAERHEAFRAKAAEQHAPKGLDDLLSQFGDLIAEDDAAID